MTCSFCHGQPVGNAAEWVDGKPQPPAPCPRCGELSQPRERLRVKVRDLQPGDYLIGSKRTVSHINRVPHRSKNGGLKHFVLLEGEKSARSWGRYTEMEILR